MRQGRGRARSPRRSPPPARAWWQGGRSGAAAAPRVSREDGIETTNKFSSSQDEIRLDLARVQPLWVAGFNSRSILRLFSGIFQIEDIRMYQEALFFA
jgi:hypothetical protein